MNALARPALLELSDGEFHRAWTDLSIDERNALPDDVRRQGLDRFNGLTPYIKPSVERAQRAQERREAAALFDRREPGVPAKVTQSKERAPLVQPLDWRELARRGDPPRREWLVEPWLPRGHTALIAGPGGLGKTLLAQQFGSAGAIAADFISPAAAFSSLMWGCEDDEAEFWRRQAHIAAHYGVSLETFAEKFFMVPRAGEDNVIASTEFGRLLFTPRLEELRQQAHDLRVDAVILDNARHLYLGDENNNAAVTLFLNTLSGALRGMAVILIGHTSRAMGSEYANGAAWENACRTRLYFGERLPDEVGERDEEPDPHVRILARRKANYAAKDLRRFRFEGGVLVPDAAAEPLAGGMVGHLRTARIERTLLAAAVRLAEMGNYFTDASNSPQFLPRLVLQFKLGEGATRKELSDAMRSVMLDGRMVRGVVGKYPNRTDRIGLKVAK